MMHFNSLITAIFYGILEKICRSIEIDQEKCSTQLVATVEMLVKSHSSQKKIDLSTAENASKSISPNHVVAEAMVEDQVMAEAEAEAMVEDQVMAKAEDLDLVEDQVMVEVQETTDHEKCLTQNVVTVVMIVKYHSSQKTIDPFIAKIVSKITEETRKIVLSNSQNFEFLFFINI